MSFSRAYQRYADTRGNLHLPSAKQWFLDGGLFGENLSISTFENVFKDVAEGADHITQAQLPKILSELQMYFMVDNGLSFDKVLLTMFESLKSVTSMDNPEKKRVKIAPGFLLLQGIPVTVEDLTITSAFDGCGEILSVKRDAAKGTALMEFADVEYVYGIYEQLPLILGESTISISKVSDKTEVCGVDGGNDSASGLSGGLDPEKSSGIGDLSSSCFLLVTNYRPHKMLPSYFWNLFTLYGNLETVFMGPEQTAIKFENGSSAALAASMLDGMSLWGLIMKVEPLMPDSVEISMLQRTDCNIRRSSVCTSAPSDTICVDLVPIGMNEDSLRGLFDTRGTVLECVISSNVMGVRSARVKLLSVEQGTEAVMVHHGYKFRSGSKLSITFIQ